ncbi:hypothetical protein HY838_00745 [Candidatus Azambacteria bacterium]|nr:hypothetical protein [Candidatus Azambacteria bacterium]
MKNFLTKNKKYLGLIVIAVIVFNFIFPFSAVAAEKDDSSIADTLLGWISAKALLGISDFVSTIFGAIFGVILYLEAQIIDYILSPSNFSFTNAMVVKLGWGITRDLGNMFLILILLVIAFSTVLRIQSYAIKQLWWKVLVAALLVNFSLVIAGFIIDFTQVLTTYFIKQSTGQGFTTITVKLANAMKITNFYNPALPTTVMQGITQFGASAVAGLVGMVLTLIGLVITVFVFGATAIFLIVRILYIWMLLIFAPIVWMLWILPATSKYFSQWWNKFIQWAFFAPIYVFMIYLSLSIFDQSGKIRGDVFFGTSPQGWNTVADGLTQVSLPSAIFQWILVIALMFGALIVAQNFGVYGAKGSQDILKKWGTGTRNWAGRYARRKGLEWTRPLPEGAPPPTGLRGGLRKIGAAIGGAAVAVPGVRGAYLKQLEAERKAYSTAYDKYKNVDPAVLEQAQKGILAPQERLAVRQTLMEKKRFKPTAEQLMPMLDEAKRYGKEGDFIKIAADKMPGELSDKNGYNIEQREELVRRAKNNGIEKELYATLPVESAKVLEKSLDEIIGKIKSADAFKINELSLKNKEVITVMANKFTGEHVMNAAKNDRSDIIDAIEDGIKEIGIEQFKTDNPRLAKWIQKSPGSTFFKISLGEEEKKEGLKKEAPAITVVGPYAKIPPLEERKG